MIPEAFRRQMETLLGGEAEDFFACLDQPARRGLRLNPRRDGAEAAAAAYVDEQVPWCPAGRYVKEGTAPGKDILHAAGAYYLQEPSAMAPAEVLAPRPGERVLDLCAAPGGKSGRVADMLAGQGLLVSNEIEKGRARILASNLERLGVTNAVVTSESPDRLAARWPEAFDAILVDAPCSGEGMFRRVPEARSEWKAESPAGCAARQAKILDAAAAMLAPGGRLVYSTCTFNRLENEETIGAFLRRQPDYSPEDFALPGVGPSENGCLRLWPHRLQGEGHFVAKVRKAGELPQTEFKPLRPDKAARAALSFLGDSVLAELPRWLERANLILEKDLLLAAPSAPEGPALSKGVALCRVGKGYVVPEHALAMALLPGQAFRALDVDADQAARLLRGESLPCDGKGWTLATYQKMPLCWGKCVDGVFKNHLPKGLRVCF